MRRRIEFKELLEFFRQILLHPLTAASGIVTVTAVLCIFVVRVPARTWLPPTVVGLGLVTEAIATIGAMRVFMVAFRESPPAMAQAGLKQVAATILDSRVPRVVGAMTLLALAAVGFVSVWVPGTSSEVAGASPGGTSNRLRAAVTLTLSSVAALLIVILALWETRQASWIVRTFAEGPLDFSLVLKAAPPDIHSRVGLSVLGLGFLGTLSFVGGLVLAVLVQALATTESPPAWTRRGHLVLLAVVALVALATLVGVLGQRSWLRAVIATGKVPGLVLKAGTASAKFPPCRSHPPGTGVAELADVNEPVELDRVAPVYPEFARRSRIQGDVLLEAVVEKDGTVSFVCVVRGVDPLLDEAAGNAVLQSTYKPATRRSDGAPVPVYLPVTVTFQLE